MKIPGKLYRAHVGGLSARVGRGCAQKRLTPGACHEAEADPGYTLRNIDR